MKLAYVDTSWMVAIAFGEAGAARLAARLRRFDRLLSSNLLEAELRSALLREGVRDQAEGLLSWITWIYPNRPLSAEFTPIRNSHQTQSPAEAPGEPEGTRVLIASHPTYKTQCGFASTRANTQSLCRFR